MATPCTITINTITKGKQMSEQETAIEVNHALAEPPMYNVVYVNDDETSMEFVIDSLVHHFSHGQLTAEKLAVAVHTEGEASVATLPYEVAEQKGIEVTFEARRNGYPLQIRLEKDIH